MAWVDVDELPLVWWNTSLAPPVNARNGSAADVDFVCNQIKLMRDELEFGVLGLAEVNADDLAAIMQKLSDTSLQLIDATGRDSYIIHDTAIIFDRRKLRFDSYSVVSDEYGKKTGIKIGVLVKFVVVANGETLWVVASHWLSRITSGQYEPIRVEYGMALRATVRQIRDEFPNPKIILMGDYNDDPSSPSLAEHLLATRDRSLTRRYADYFYNPFWRLMGESEHEDGGAATSICGTLYFPKGNLTEWHTFDQMMFSPALLTGPSMLFCESDTRIVTSASLDAKVRSTGTIFDHFPVCSKIILRAFLP